jgi:hypothetical protein
MKFTIEIDEVEIGKVAAILGRPLLIAPIESARKNLGGRPKSPKPTAVMRVVEGNQGPTAKMVGYALTHKSFTSLEIAQDLKGEVLKDTMHSTLIRLVDQGVLSVRQEPGQKKLFSLTEVGETMAKQLQPK